MIDILVGIYLVGCIVLMFFLIIQLNNKKRYEALKEGTREILERAGLRPKNVGMIVFVGRIIDVVLWPLLLPYDVYKYIRRKS